MVKIISQQNSIANNFIAELRNVDVQNDRMRFRRNLERLGEIMAYEISKELDYKESEIVTPLGVANTALLAEQPVIATILRAGLPMHTGMLNYFDMADNAFITAYRRHHKDGSFDINLEYVSSPSLENRVLIICDPMLATGQSLVLTYKALMQYGRPRKTYIAAAIASRQGIEHTIANMHDVLICCGAVDEELTSKAYIVPGLGDAGDLAYGSK